LLVYDSIAAGAPCGCTTDAVIRLVAPGRIETFDGETLTAEIPASGAVTVTGTRAVCVAAAKSPFAADVAVTVMTAEPGATAVIMPVAASTFAIAGAFVP
jgi:hypothetical protein